MVDLIKGCTEINLHDSSSLPTLQCTLQCMANAQKYFTGTQPFPKTILVVESPPLCSTNRPRRTDTRCSNTLDNTDVMEVGRLLATEQYVPADTFQKWGDIGRSLANRETTQTNKQAKHYTETGANNICSSLRKKRKHT